MEFRVLGPVAFGEPDGWREPKGRLRRRLLATLLAKVGQVVSHDQLAVALWGDLDGLPPMSRLHLQVHRLRQELADRDLIVAADDGYRLSVDPTALDMVRFDDLARTALGAAGRDPATGEAARAALAEWTVPWDGSAFEGIDTTICLDEAARLAERRLDVAEVFFDQELAAGRHLDVLGDVRSLADAHPVRESLQALLMRALHQAGRQQEGLAVYRRTRTILVEELGLEPSARLRAAQEAILTGVDPAVTRADAPPPAQLPPAPDLIGREDALAELDRALCGVAPSTSAASVACVVSGPPGAGKTAVAVSWALRHRDRFPDGQLFVDLRGFSPSQPVHPDVALDGFIRGLGGDPTGLRTTDERTATFRSLVAGRQLLIMLDNARSADQVRPLLPGTPGCRVAVTSRDRLAGLIARDQAVPVSLARMPLADALTLLRGPELADDERETRWRVLAERCDRLPLLLRIAAERVRTDPRDLAILAGATDSAETLDLLEFGDSETSARSLFAWSYRALPAVAAQLFRSLGLVADVAVDPRIVGAMAGVDRRQARQAVDALVRSHLVRRDGDGWLSMHDLTAGYAAESVASVDRAEREAMLVRGLDTVEEAHLRARRWASGASDDTPEDGWFADAADALAWQRRSPELTVTLAASAPHTADRTVAVVASRIDGHLRRMGRFDLAERIGEAALAAAERLGDPRLTGIAEGMLAATIGRMGDRTTCLSRFDTAVELLDRHGLPGNRFAVGFNRAALLLHFGSASAALGQLDAVEPVCAEMSDSFGGVRRTTHLVTLRADVLCELGRAEEAERLAVPAVAAAREQGAGPEVLCAATVTLARVALARGRPDEAIEHAEQAREIAITLADRSNECDAGVVLGSALLAVGDRARAVEVLTGCRVVAESSGHPMFVTRSLIALAQAHESEPRTALAHYERATVLARRRSLRRVELDALQGQCAMLRRLGRAAEAALGEERVRQLSEELADRTGADDLNTADAASAS